MGRLVFFLLLFAGGGWIWVNGIDFAALDPRGVGTRIEGRAVIRDADQVEARFSVVGSHDESYMLFGGDAKQRRNGLTHATLAGLPIREARHIATRHPDFHLCKSAGASEAQRLVETLSFVAADRSARSALSRAVDLFEDRVESGGERTCIRVTGAPLVLDSVRVKENDADMTEQVAPALARSTLILAKRVQIQDCQPLLR